MGSTAGEQFLGQSLPVEASECLDSVRLDRAIRERYVDPIPCFDVTQSHERAETVPASVQVSGEYRGASAGTVWCWSEAVPAQHPWIGREPHLSIRRNSYRSDVSLDADIAHRDSHRVRFGSGR